MGQCEVWLQEISTKPWLGSLLHGHEHPPFHRLDYGKIH